jgi:uncharacterized OsmC-like protein
MSDGEAVTAHLQLLDGYGFRVDFGQGRGELIMDEPEPLGAGSGPNASAVLGAAVANCLSASLLFCLRKARIEVKGLKADVTVSTSRNERGRLRVSTVKVELRPEVAPADAGRLPGALRGLLCRQRGRAGGDRCRGLRARARGHIVSNLRP